MKRVIKESQLRKLIRSNLVALSESVSDELMMEMHGLLMEEEMGWYQTYQTIKLVFTVLGLVLAVCVILVAIGTVTVGSGGGFLAALAAAALTLKIPLTIVGVMNFCLSILNYEKNDSGEIEHKPDWFSAIVSLLSTSGSTLKLFKNGASALSGLGKQGNVIMKLSKMNLNDGVLAKVVKSFEINGISWDIISPIKSAWNVLSEVKVNKNLVSMIFEQDKDEEVVSINWDQLKVEFDKDSKLGEFNNKVNEIYNSYKSSDKNANEIFAKQLIELYTNNNNNV